MALLSYPAFRSRRTFLKTLTKKLHIRLQVRYLRGGIIRRVTRSNPRPLAIKEETIMSHDQVQSCIDACNACAGACEHCTASCLIEDDVKMMSRCIALDIDCAAVCRLAASFLSRGSEFSGQICEACADICDACGEECAKHTHEHCLQCAEACRLCAQECRSMGQHAASGNDSHRIQPAAH